MHQLTSYASEFMSQYAAAKRRGDAMDFNTFKRQYGKLEDLDLLHHFMSSIEHERFMLDLKFGSDFAKAERPNRQRKLEILEKEFNYLLGRDMPDDC